MKVHYKELFALSKDLNLLYIEDDYNFREETSEIFKDLFVSVDVASNGEEALDKYLDYYEKNQKFYDIIISDLNMPKMNGLELTKNIFLTNPHQAIIIVSAHNETQYLLELVEIGIEQFLMKPLDFDVIFSVLYKTVIKILPPQTLNNEDLQTLSFNEKNYHWNTKLSSLTYENQEVTLSDNERILMQLFIKNKSKIATFDIIATQLKIKQTDLIKEIILGLKNKLPQEAIENIYSLGYRLNLDM